MPFSLKIWRGPNAIENQVGTYPTLPEAERDAVLKSNQDGSTYIARDDAGVAVRAYRGGVEVDLPDGANQDEDEDVVDSDAKTKVH